MKYKNLDLTADSVKAYADVASNINILGGEMDSAKAQHKLALLNHQVILDGLKKLHGLNTNFDRKVDTISRQIKKALSDKKVSFIKIFLFHILFFIVLFFISIMVRPELFSVGYLASSVGMGCATGVLNLMLVRERGKYTFNQVLLFLEEAEIEQYFELHKELAKIIDENDDVDEKIVEEKIKSTISKYIN